MRDKSEGGFIRMAYRLRFNKPNRLSTHGNSKNPVVVQVTGLDVSAGLWYMPNPEKTGQEQTCQRE